MLISQGNILRLIREDGIRITQTSQARNAKLPELIHRQTRVEKYSLLPWSFDRGMVAWDRGVTVFFQDDRFVCLGADGVVLDDPG